MIRLILSIILALSLVCSASMTASAQDEDKAKKLRFKVAAENLQDGNEEYGLNILELECIGDPETGIEPDDFACYVFFSHFSDNPEFPAIRANPETGKAGIERFQSLGAYLCQSGNPKGCSRLYALYDKYDNDEARKLKLTVVDIGCGLGDTLQCRLLASMHLIGEETPYNWRAGMAAMQSGCNFGDRETCVDLATYMSDGVFGEAPDELVAKFALKACPEQGADECVKAAALLVDYGSDADLIEVRRMLDSACHEYAQKEGCAALIRDYELGVSGPKDMAEAKESRAHACYIGMKDMCAD
ncbi:MAG: hypothetical protein AAFX02_06890 [Pseudomonadota bacterium]